MRVSSLDPKLKHRVVSGATKQRLHACWLLGGNHDHGILIALLLPAVQQPGSGAPQCSNHLKLLGNDFQLR